MFKFIWGRGQGFRVTNVACGGKHEEGLGYLKVLGEPVILFDNLLRTKARVVVELRREGDYMSTTNVKTDNGL